MDPSPVESERDEVVTIFYIPLVPSHNNQLQLKSYVLNGCVSGLAPQLERSSRLKAAKRNKLCKVRGVFGCRV